MLNIFILLGIRFPELFHLAKLKLCPLNNARPPPRSATGNYFLFQWIWLLCVLHVSGVMQYLSFCDWFIFLSIMSSGSVNPPVLFFFKILLAIRGTLVFIWNLWLVFLFLQKICPWDFDSIALNLSVTLGSTDVLTMLLVFQSMKMGYVHL